MMDDDILWADTFTMIFSALKCGKVRLSALKVVKKQVKGRYKAEIE
jgi:hypothetical protein